MLKFLGNGVERIIGGFERKDEREFLPAALEVVETPASPSSRILIFLIVSFVLIAVIWAFIGRVDINATAEGRILPAGDVKIIQPLDPGTVKAIHVQNGQYVHKGELLIELDPTQPAADRDKLAGDLTQANLDAARLKGLKDSFLHGGTPVFKAPANVSPIAAAETQAAMKAQAAQLASKLADLNQQIAQMDAEKAQADATVAKYRAEIPTLTEADRINRELMAKGFGQSLAALSAAQALSDAKNEIEISLHMGEQAVAQRAALEQQKREARAQYQADVLSDLRKAETQQNENGQDLVKAQDKSTETTLRAPNDGYIEQLSVHTLGGVVLPGQHLMIVVPDTRHLVVEAKLANKDVGFILPGQSVKVKVETYAFTRYGIVEGKVIDVSRYVIDPDPKAPAPQEDPQQQQDDSSAIPNQASPTYVARISIATTSMIVDGQKRPLRPGMSVTAEIRTGTRSIADYMLSPLTKKMQESLHER
jgi:hemolysin D